MKEFRVSIPQEHYDILNFTSDELPGVAVVNSALKKFTPKEAFAWHLEVSIQLKELIENGMPSQDEVNIVDAFGDNLDELIKGSNNLKPNALFLARITWNGLRELIWRVNDPKTANSVLQDLMTRKDYPREFEFDMSYDKRWELSGWYLTDWPRK